MTGETTRESTAARDTERQHLEFARSEAGAPLQSLLAQARRRIDCYAPRLDLPVFASSAAAETLAHFVVASRQNRIRLLIGDERWFLRHNPRLVELARRFPSFMEVRRPPEELEMPDECFVVVDDAAHFQQPKLDDPRCILITGDRRGAARLQRRFDAEWELGEPLAELFTTGL